MTTTAADALVERLFSAAVASFDLAGVYLGDRLGWYASLAADGPATPDELAERTGTDARYAREWLEQQAVAGLLAVDGDHRFSMPDGADMREGQAAFNRPALTHLLGSEWLPGAPDVHARLRADPSAKVADIGCGEGWSTIAMARAYPNGKFVGVDLDAPSTEAARQHAADAGVGDRVEFRHADVAALEGDFDAALIVEAVHDMANPVPVLAAVRGALREGGSLIVVDERVAEVFTAPGDDMERFMYGWSITTCLPDGRSRQPSRATGTVMRPDTVRAYATEAGFGSVEVLAVENDFFRFYQLRP